MTLFNSGIWNSDLLGKLIPKVDNDIFKVNENFLYTTETNIFQIRCSGTTNLTWAGGNEIFQ